MATCANGHQVAEGKKFCGTCGCPTSTDGIENGITCTNGHPNRPGAKFCRVCGGSFGTPAPAPAANESPTLQRNEFHATPPVGGLRAYESEVLPPERQTTRNLVVLLLDNSGSMTEAGFSPTRTKLAELNDALGSFLSSSMHQVPQLEMNGEIAIGTFAYNRLDWVALGEGSVSPSSPFHYARYVRDFPEILPTQGTTPMDVAVLEGLSAIEARKRSLAAAGFVHESRPVMFLLTDGESSNDMTAAIARLREAEAAKKVLFFALGVGEVDDQAMRAVAPTSYYSLKDQPLEACLRFVSGSLGVLSGVNDSAEMMYDTVRRANSRSNMSADDFLRGFSAT